ncbi:hypothetical protein ACN27G_04495 [Plantactinospora sp. WMMB334]|uniref:hypothetical protein n=1 Tax=Plantactinospora sp. WMMB334 TaxID=3404119 RepID=UPI003B960A15
MRLEIAREVFDLGDPALLRKLIDLAIEGRHEWRPDLDEAVYVDERSDRLPPDQREYLEKLVIEAADPTPPSSAATAQVTLAELRDMVSDLAKPAVLVLENRFSDGEFVQRVAAVFGEDRIVEALDAANEWLRLCNGGGTGQLAESAIAECKMFRMLVRVAVLLDSDRAHAGAVSDYEPKVTAMRAAGVPEVHMLLLRMIENYLPLKAWEHHFAHQPEKVDALRRRPLAERHYLHLKTHFGRRNMPKRLLPEDLMLTTEDFAELGEDAVADLRELFAMIHRIL